MPRSVLVSVTNDLNQDQRMHRICSCLHDEGYDVIFVGRQKRDSDKLLSQPFKQRRLKCIFESGIFFYLEYNLRLLIFTLQMKPNAIYAVDLDTLFSGGIASNILDCRLIHDAHEYFVEVPELEGKTFKKAIWNWVGRKFIRACDLCITVNQELADILGKKYNNTFEVVRSVPLAVEHLNEKKPEGGPRVILYQGVLNKGRGLKEAILAMKDMNKHVQFRIAGEGDLSEELRKITIQEGLADRVMFLGWLNPFDLKEETRKADIGLNLLDASSLNYKYSLANKFFDYMHAGVPSINMNFPVYSRICKEFEVGLCIDHLAPENIRSAIVHLLSDEEVANNMKKNCKEASMVYNWQQESLRLAEMVNKVLK